MRRTVMGSLGRDRAIRRDFNQPTSAHVVLCRAMVMASVIERVRIDTDNRRRDQRQHQQSGKRPAEQSVMSDGRHH